MVTRKLIVGWFKLRTNLSAVCYCTHQPWSWPKPFSVIGVRPSGLPAGPTTAISQHRFEFVNRSLTISGSGFAPECGGTGRPRSAFQFCLPCSEKGHSLSEVILATEIAMLFLYLPFIILEAWMFSPRKRNMGELTVVD